MPLSPYSEPYHRQVRPFGFMVMFQQEVSAKTEDSTTSGKRSRKRAQTVLRVIAPFNRDPAKAARQAFDRDTGKPVSLKQLKSYSRALRHYYDHPEAKFLNGERTDRGPTKRRHIIARSIRHIGKEANKLDDQFATGTDPEAQAEFGAISANRFKRLMAIRTALRKFGPSLLARQAGLSRQHLSKLVGGEVAVTQGTLAKIDQAVVALTVVEIERSDEADSARAWVRSECDRASLRQVAATLGVNAGNLSRMVAGTRPISKTLVRAIAVRRS